MPPDAPSSKPVPSPKPLPIRPGSVLKAAALGLPVDAASDLCGPIQAALAQLPSPARVRIDLAVGDFRFDSPLLITQDNVSIRGEGESLTRIQCMGRFPGIIVGPLGDTASDGFAFSAGGRPDLFGLVGNDLAPGTATAFGFATQTRTVLSIQSHGLQLGSWTNTGWDYHASANGLTIDLAVKGPPTPGDSLFGLGSYQSPVGFGVVVIASDRPNAIGWALRFADDPSTTHNAFFNGFTVGGLNRVRLWFDPLAGDVGAWLRADSGAWQPAAPAWYGQPPAIKGRKLLPNARGFPVILGSNGDDVPLGQAIPDITFAGFRLSNTARRDCPTTDSDMLTGVNENTIGYLAVGYREPGRLVRVIEGPAAQSGTSFGLALDSKFPGTNVSGFRLEGVTLENFSPGILLAQTFSTVLRDVTAIGGRVGLGTVPYGDNYPVDTTACTFSGDDVGRDLYGTFGLTLAENYTGGGVTSYRSSGSGVANYGTRWSFFGNAPESAAAIWGGNGYAYGTIFDGVDVDNESLPFSVANFQADLAPYRPVSLFVRGGSAGLVAPGQPVIQLSGSVDGVHLPGTIQVAGLAWPGGGQGGNPAVMVTGSPGSWMGSIDTRAAIPPLQPSGGAGLDPSALVVQVASAPPVSAATPKK